MSLKLLATYFGLASLKTLQVHLCFASVVVRFLLKSSFDTPRLDAILTTATALVNSHQTGGERIDNELPALLEMVTGFVHRLGGTFTKSSAASQTGKLCQ